MISSNLESARNRSRAAVCAAIVALACSLPALATAAPAGAVNLNTATAEQLADQLVGVGPEKAQAIIAYREANGGFSSVDEFEAVPGIGPATLQNNRERLTLGGDSVR